MGSSTGNATIPVFVVTGTSGAGKGTLERALLSQMPELELAVSATTRERREGEENGREYWFISDEEFDEKLARRRVPRVRRVPLGPALGHAALGDRPDHRTRGGFPLLDLEPQGALDVKNTVPGAVTIFVEAPSFEENERRLRARATESEGEIEDRLELAREQLSQADEFDHLIVNDDLDRALSELTAIVRGKVSAAGTMSRP